jgi:hypothetical protein
MNWIFLQPIAKAMDLHRASCLPPLLGHGRVALMFKIAPGDFVSPNTVSISFKICREPGPVEGWAGICLTRRRNVTVTRYGIGSDLRIGTA